MVYIITLILAISLDALSFGLAQGFSKNKIPFVFVFCMTIFSTFLFALPLYTSSLIVNYLNESILKIVNGIVLLLLGIYYLIDSIFLEKNNIENRPLSFWQCMLSVLPISLDAIFTAFLSGYRLNFVIFGIVFYFVITFLAIFVGNRISYKLSNKSIINLGWLSGVLFILLGILKLCGF